MGNLASRWMASNLSSVVPYNETMDNNNHEFYNETINGVGNTVTFTDLTDEVKKEEENDARLTEKLASMSRKDLVALPFFSLNTDRKYIPVRVSHVYDGDSFHVVAVIHDELIRVKTRLLGLDTPERSRVSSQHSIVGHLVRRVVEAILTNDDNTVVACFHHFGKYGRVLVSIRVKFAASGYLESIDLTDWLIEQGMANEYDGRTRRPEWSAEVLEYARTIASSWLPRLT